MLAVLTGIGLSAAAGLNAYIPFLVVALIARFSDVITLPTSFAWIESGWAIGIGAVLLLAEVLLDKVVVIDSVNDAIQTAVRPASAGIIVAATTAAGDFEQSSSFFQENSWVGISLGVAVALLVHSGKSAARPVVNASTFGTGAPVVSAVEDTASIGLALLAIFVPVLALLAVIALLVAMVMLVRRALRVRRRFRTERGRALP